MQQQITAARPPPVAAIKMSTPRLLFLSHRLLRASEGSPKLTIRPTQRAALSSASRRQRPEAATTRYGTANEPPAHLGGGRAIPSTRPKDAEQKKLPEPEVTDKTEKQASQTPDAEQQKPRQRTSLSDPPNENQQLTDVQAASGTQSSKPPSITSSTNATLLNDPASARINVSALQNILQMQPPMSTASDTAPPHLQTPRHVHHFDTYSLVQDLISSKTFTDAQAITIMKALRLILADNIDLARAGLMSRSDAEMDAYQFRAASSELRTELRQRRAASADRMRADRSQLQHEVDILGQRMTQESLNLKDELKGMFDDRKMVVRTERRGLENRIQELGYKITVAMNSGMRNEIEALRFLVTRNAAITLACFIAGSLMMLYMAARRKARDQKAEAEKKEREKYEKKLRDSGQLLAPPTHTKEELVKRIEEGGDPSLVSLG